MSIFGKIKDAIFGGEAKAEPAPAPPPAPNKDAATPAPAPTPTASQPAPKPASEPAPAPSSQPAPAPTSGSPSGGTASSSPAQQPSTAQPVDVAAILDKAVAEQKQKLDWRNSIVDTMKALGMESSLSERRELADELGYTGDKHDTAAMNMWLQKALMKKLAENGGKVPAELTD